MERPIDAPMCFAAASVFAHESDICRGCTAFVGCEAASLETLEKIRSLINVEDLLKRHAAARKVALVGIRKADAQREADMPPGNFERPLPKKPVVRKTAAVVIKFEPSPSESVSITSIGSKKAKEVAQRMVKSNDLAGVRAALAVRGNYYAERGPSFLRVAIDKLLRGGFTKRSLTSAYQDELGWTKETAASHVSMVCWILTGFKLAQEINGLFMLVPATSA